MKYIMTFNILKQNNKKKKLQLIFFLLNASHYIIYIHIFPYIRVFQRKSEINEHMRFSIKYYIISSHPTKIQQGIVYIKRTLTFTSRKHELLNF